MFENVNIKEFPRTMCNLLNLQTLIIENCLYLEKLPQWMMSKLINLRHLMFGQTRLSNTVFLEGKIIVYSRST